MSSASDLANIRRVVRHMMQVMREFMALPKEGRGDFLIFEFKQEMKLPYDYVVRSQIFHGADPSEFTYERPFRGSEWLIDDVIDLIYQEALLQAYVMTNGEIIESGVEPVRKNIGEEGLASYWLKFAWKRT